jgi:DNA-directed RNA polymerase III subunit RPC6
VVDRCLKSLVQKKLIKRIPAMNNKKIYMLEGLEPSVELTGGAWYIDGELDTGLIHHLTEACLKIVREMVSCTSWLDSEA